MTALACSLLLVVSSQADESWPEFRGPTRQGHATGPVPLHWSATSNVVWKAPVPGQGWSSPVYRDGKLYLTTAVSEGGLSLRALCLDPKDGTILWNTEVFRPKTEAKIHSKNGRSSPTPIIEKDLLYVHFGHDGSAALDLAGKIVWQNTEHSYVPVHGNGASPAIVGERFIFPADDESKPTVVALDKRTGKTLWTQARESGSQRKFSFATPLAIEVDGQTEVVSPAAGVVAGLKPDDGSEIWRVTYGNGYSVIPRPVVGFGMIFLATGYDRPWVYAIRTGGHGDVTETHVAWKLVKGAPNTPSLLLVGDELYMVSDGGIASCLDAKTGVVHWSERVGGNFSSSPIDANGRIYFQNEEGIATVVAAGKKFEVLAKNDLGERTLASYAVAEDALFIRTASHLWRIAEPTVR
jgi:outer membrane protein assembly factor BamB